MLCFSKYKQNQTITKDSEPNFLGDILNRRRSDRAERPKGAERNFKNLLG